MLYGVPSFQNFIYSSTFTFRITSNKNYVDIPIDLIFMKSKSPALISYIDSVNIYYGVDVIINCLFNVSSSESYNSHISSM